MSSRSYRIDPGVPVPDEVRRVARGRIDHAIDELRGDTESSRAQAVHEARKAGPTPGSKGVRAN